MSEDDKRAMWREWAGRWVARLTRPLRHAGNHKYCWPFHKAFGLEALPYPKARAS
jgi:hypothetical protein